MRSQSLRKYAPRMPSTTCRKDQPDSQVTSYRSTPCEHQNTLAQTQKNSLSPVIIRNKKLHTNAQKINPFDWNIPNLNHNFKRILRNYRYLFPRIDLETQPQSMSPNGSQSQFKSQSQDFSSCETPNVSGLNSFAGDQLGNMQAPASVSKSLNVYSRNFRPQTMINQHVGISNHEDAKSNRNLM